MSCPSCSRASAWVVLWSAGLALGLAAAAAADDRGQAPHVRKFKFFYGATINELAPGTAARVWIPVATSSHEQKVRLAAARTPGKPHYGKDKTYGNQTIYFEATADERGEIEVDLEYLVERRELLADQGEPAPAKIPREDLVSSKLIPVNGTLVRKLLGDELPEGDAEQKARTLYDAVDALMTYDKPEDQPWGRGDALWACDSGFGNCTDFHSVFIGACRDLGIPAKFEMGFPLPQEKGAGEVPGYHCWAKFVHDGRWQAVDISEADKNPDLKEYYFGNLAADRVTFTVGRDLELEPPTQSGPVNFLIYPYVEAAGRPHTNFVKRFRYEDVE